MERQKIQKQIHLNKSSFKGKNNNNGLKLKITLNKKLLWTNGHYGTTWQIFTQKKKQPNYYNWLFFHFLKLHIIEEALFH